MTVEVSVVERVRSIVEPLLAARSVGLYDVEQAGATLRILVETADLEVVAVLTRAISHALDDADPIESRYTLEVSSPGLERPLRTPAHFTGAVGSAVTIKTAAGVEGDRRVRGTLTATGAGGLVVRDETGAERALRYEDVERARTLFEWGPPPKPGKPAAGEPRAGAPTTGVPATTHTKPGSTKTGKPKVADPAKVRTR